MPPTHQPTAADELRWRMRKPQRHRLLHGYPLAAALPGADKIDPDDEVTLDPHRELLVGVLPHPFCNPQVTGCGFCTFPHEPGNAAKGTAVVRRVIQEIDQAVDRHGVDFLNRPVAALYFGGGTANMTESAAFRDLCRALNDVFDLTGAEVTLEGVPAYFLRGHPRLVQVLRDELPARHFRLSMGVQTFDPARLKQMGRTAFGDRETFAEVVNYGHDLGFTVSGDFLFNLPGQTLDEMKRDLAEADAIGLDHLGLYHLVMFNGLGTPWSQDEDLLADLPDNDRAAANWLALREQLLAGGFVQATLTNFERAAFRGRADRYVYEEYTFQPDRYQVLGFGPSAVTYAATADFAHGIKTMNPVTADEYSSAVQAGKRVWSRYFAYGPRDQRVFWLTRRLAGLSIDGVRYRELFGTGLQTDFAEEFAAVEAAGLVEIAGDEVCPTPVGMFYSDSIAAVLASAATRETRNRRLSGRPDEVDPALLHDARETHNSFGHM